MKKYFGIVLLVSILLIGVAIAGKPDLTPVNPDLVLATNNKAGVSVIIPEHAVKLAENIFSLGISQDVDGRIVEGFLFIDKREGNAKPGTECGNGMCEPGENANKCPADCGGNGGGDTGPTSTCFELFAKGAGWKTTEQYVLDTTNNNNLSDSFVAERTELSLNEWNNEVTSDIFGTRNTNLSVDGPDSQSPDGKNEVQFLNLGESNTIAFTIVWGIFRGPPSGRELVEWDAVFNDNYAFGNSGLTDEANLGDTSVMDYQNIATHEFGHSAGLTHPADTCAEETMYAFAGFGETKKRTLNAGDIAGANKLY